MILKHPVTGTGHGLGRRIAINFARMGALVVCWDKDTEKNTSTNGHWSSVTRLCRTARNKQPELLLTTVWARRESSSLLALLQTSDHCASVMRTPPKPPHSSDAFPFTSWTQKYRGNPREQPMRTDVLGRRSGRGCVIRIYTCPMCIRSMQVPLFVINLLAADEDDLLGRCSAMPVRANAILFTRRGTGPLQPLRVEGTAVQWSPSVRWLGVTLDARCSWDPHLRSAAGRARGVMLKLAPLLRPVSPLEYGHKIRLFLLCVMSILLYSAPVFSYLPRYRYNHFRTVYHRFLRLILGAPPRVPNRVLLTMSGLPSLDSRIRGLAVRFFTRAQASSNMIVRGIGDYDAPGHPYRRIRDGVVNPFVDVGR
uniref:Uncharacterized protein n=1 Tax=Timema monikensis TaxID=170555 RepID=A0A7R9EGZ4_9NEOP|nr:unnamed protein product [Timema monikensis]